MSRETILEHIAAHRTIRSFRPTDLPEEEVREAVRAAQMAATSSWIQAYGLLRVVDPNERARLAELCGGQAQVAEAGAFFVVSGDLRRHRVIAERAGAERVDNLETTLLAIVDACLFAQNLVLAFEAQGHGTCYIGGLRNRLPEVDRLLELPSGVLPLFGLCVGESAGDPGQRPRLGLDAIYSRGRYPSDDELMASIARADEVAARYYDQRGASGRDWSGGIWRKFTKAMRPDLRAYYESKGARFD